MINTALADIRARVNGCTLNGLGPLRDRLIDMVNCSLEIDCSTSSCATLEGQTRRGEAKVTLFCPASQTQNRLNAVLFHEMIHAAGGTELDAEALENHCYAGAGANAPTLDDWAKFEGDGGEFVIWDSATGQLFVKIETGGSWIEPPTVTRGDMLTPIFLKPAGAPGGSWI